MPVSDDVSSSQVNYRQRYRNLKRKYRYLIYENECFQEELRKAQRKLLKVNQDKSFLLDRLLQYERIEDTSSDSDVTISSDSELDNFSLKKKKTPAVAGTSGSHVFTNQAAYSMANRQPALDSIPKRKKPTASKTYNAATSASVSPITSAAAPVLNMQIKVEPLDEPEVTVVTLSQGDGHMTSEEIERHLESRQSLMDLVPERAPPTVPTEMFSNDTSGLESGDYMDGGGNSANDADEDDLIIDLTDQQNCL